MKNIYTHLTNEDIKAIERIEKVIIKLEVKKNKKGYLSKSYRNILANLKRQKVELSRIH